MMLVRVAALCPRGGAGGRALFVCALVLAAALCPREWWRWWTRPVCVRDDAGARWCTVVVVDALVLHMCEW